MSGASTMKMSVFVQPEGMMAAKPAFAIAAPAPAGVPKIEGESGLLGLGQEQLKNGQYEDAYAKAVAELVDAKLAGVAPAPVTTPDEVGSAEVVDLLTALQRSVERAKAARGESPAESESTEAKKPAKKAATKAKKKAAAK